MSHDPTLDSFIDMEDEAPREIPTLDRSTLELYADCPRSARLLEKHRPNMPDIANVGQECHEALGATVSDWVKSDGGYTTTDLSDAFREHLQRSRPDVQLQAIIAAVGCSWKIAEYLREIHPDNFLGWDGGPEGKTGQLSSEIGGVIVTSELDLLHAGPSPEELFELDLKSGHKTFSATDVKESFQFQMHAFLVFSNFPKVNTLSCRVLNSRTRTMTPVVQFLRDYLDGYRYCVESAVEAWRLNQDKLAEVADAWPSLEKCDRCDVSFFCEYQGPEEKAIAEDPSQAVGALIAIEERRSAVKRALTAFVRKNGEIEGPDGVFYGCNKPKTERKSYDLYEPK